MDRYATVPRPVKAMETYNTLILALIILYLSLHLWLHNKINMVRYSKLRGSKKRRQSAFTQGNDFYLQWQEQLQQNEQQQQAHPANPPNPPQQEEEPEPVMGIRNMSRLDRETYESISLPAGATPTYLRPTKISHPKPIEVYSSTKPAVNNGILGNRVIYMNNMAHLFSEVYRKHKTASPSCDGDFIFPQEDECLWGIGTILTIKCVLCDFKSKKTKMYEEVDEIVKRGRKPAKMNTQLANVMSKISASVQDVIILFSGIECSTMHPTNLQRMVDKASPNWTSVNTQQLQINREIIQNVISHTGQPFICQTDTSYNNSPKGRAFSQPGTQSFTPLIECVTKKKLTIASTAMNTHCTKGGNCKHTDCSRNYDPQEPIGNSEVKAGRLNLEECTENNMCPDAITSDGTSLAVRGANALRTHLEKLDCTVHVTRGQRRAIYRLQGQEFQRQLGNLKIKNILARDVPNRCALELRRARAKYINNEEFYNQMELSRQCIVPCITGDHELCEKWSLVCSGKSCPMKWTWGNPLMLSAASREEMQNVINYKLSTEKVKRQRYGLNTNKAESLHNRVYHVMPKSRCYRKNYSHRTHSAVHSDSVGIVESLLKFNEKTGSKLSNGTVSIKRLATIQKKIKYFETYQDAFRFRIRRRQIQFRKIKLKQNRDAIHGPEDDSTPDHSYCRKH